ncbi:MAG: epoxyqueuosine reductase QueH [Candidatus Marinamargulisbacteria bacterium]
MMHSFSNEYDQFKKDPLVTPNSETNVLLHTCCAPCCGEVIQAMKASGINLTLFFYNPNIHPLKEYEYRKLENIKYAEKNDIAFIDADYDTDNWFDRIKGLENEPERGERCTKCFDMRFERTALYAKENGFSIFTSSLGISRWKDFNQINSCGERAAKRHPGLTYWTYNWRKRGGSERMYKISKEESFYKQEYCGCIYSLRDTNAWRKKTDRKPIHFGKEYYSES